MIPRSPASTEQHFTSLVLSGQIEAMLDISLCTLVLLAAPRAVIRDPVRE